jgi:hypothetical protein
MDNDIFCTVPLSEKSFFQKVFRQYPQENAVIELNNLLAAKPVKEVRQEDLSAIESRYKLSLEKEFKLNLEEFYAVYLHHCLNDKTLSAEELEDLKHLKVTFNLDDDTVTKLHAKIGEVVYKKVLKKPWQMAA